MFRLCIFVFTLLVSSTPVLAAPCKGKFVNPLNICWRCLFPLTIGDMAVVHGKLKDTPNPKSPIGICSNRIGLNIGYWEPFALAETSSTPYCLVNLGGLKLNLGIKQGQGGKYPTQNGLNHAFYHVHWYKYPLIAWLNFFTASTCFEGGDFDVAYMTELDPTWRDSSMSFVLHPEAMLFANPVAQASCALDSASLVAGQLPQDKLFWCAGAHGSLYPYDGHTLSATSPVQASLLLIERLNFKLHREHLIEESIPNQNDACTPKRPVVVPKSRYRFEMVNQVVDGKACYPFGYPTLRFEAGKIKPHTASQYGFLLWRKRNCTYL
jgi:conjugal transfer pilus assembly protein TraU